MPDQTTEAARRRIAAEAVRQVADDWERHVHATHPGPPVIVDTKVPLTWLRAVADDLAARPGAE